MNAADESVVIVDKHNREVGSATRREVRAKRLIHRSTYILVFNSANQLFCTSTRAAKTSIPGAAIRRSGEWFWQERAMTRALGVNSKKSSI
jgi:hypothetical protein